MFVENKPSSVLGFYIKRPSWIEIAALALALFLSVTLFVEQRVLHTQDTLSISAWAFVFLWFTPLVTPLGDSLRNVISFIIWTVSCVLFFVSSASINPGIYPLFSIVYVQIIRVIFNMIYKKEPIQLWVGSYGVGSRRFSKIENRWSEDIDSVYSMIVGAGGLLLTVFLSR